MDSLTSLAVALCLFAIAQSGCLLLILFFILLPYLKGGQP